MRGRRWLVGGLVVTLSAGGGTAYALAGREATPDYRTVAAARADVAAALSTTGTVDAARRADLGFGTDGTVATMKVHQGDKVKAGQVLGTLDSSALQAAVDRAEASYSQAVARLESDQEAQAAAVSAAAASSSASSSRQQSASRSSRTTAGSSSPAPAPEVTELAAQQQAVLAAQLAASSALTAAREALAAQQEACKEALEAQADACTSALALVQEKQAAVDEAQSALATALEVLAKTLTDAVMALQHAQQQAQEQAQQQAQQQAQDQVLQPRQDQVQAQPQAPTQTVTAAQLASDQARVEQARADLVTARQERSQATLRATRAGRVASVAVGAGDAVTAGSPVVVLIGGTAVTVTAQVPESRINRVRVGQRVRVAPPGSATSTEGRVRSIGLTADTSSGSATYQVAVSVESPEVSLPPGSQATLEIVQRTVTDATTVPVSAVTRRGDRATVRLWDGRELTTRTVTLGAVGTNRVQVTEGLEVGDRVVLADRDQEVSGAATSINDRGGRLIGPAFRDGKGGGAPTFQRAG